MSSEAQRRASAKYDKTNARYMTLKLNMKTEADLIEWLDSIDNRQGYIKRLIREDMKKASVLISKFK